jgi:AraC-like DNA-binding protein
MPPESGTVFAKAPGHRGILRLASARDKIVPVQAMSPLIALAFERGWNAGEIFPFAEFEGQRPAHAQRYVSYWEARQAFLRARHKIGDAFVVEYAFRKSLATLGLVGLGMMVHGTLGAAMRFALDYQALAGAVLRLDMETHGQETAIVARDLYQDDELRQFWRLDHLLTIANVLRQLPSEPANPIRFEIEGRIASETRQALARLLDARIVDEADRSCIVYRSKDLETPQRFPDSAAALMWRQTAERELAAIGRTDAQSLVEHFASRDGKLLGRREVSDKLGISERSLDRLLAREGVRFSELAGLQRLEKAKSSLRAGETVERAAEKLGYSDARSFRRAFQKATGMSPAEFKASL